MKTRCGNNTGDIMIGAIGAKDRLVFTVHGDSVNIAARPALEPRSGAGMVLYTAAKAAVVAITQSLAEEVAAEAIWVNAVAPSILDTAANRAAMAGAAGEGGAPKRL